MDVCMKPRCGRRQRRGGLRRGPCKPAPRALAQPRPRPRVIDSTSRDLAKLSYKRGSIIGV